MDFKLTEEQQMIVDSLGKYAEKELKPIVPKPPDVIQRFGFSNPKYWAAHI